MGELAFHGGGKHSCAGIEVIHDEHWLSLGAKQFEHSTKLRKRCSLNRQ